MKCTACGSKKLREVKGLIYEGSYSDGNAQLQGNAYVCMECGHIEIYSSKLLADAQEQKTKEDNINREISQINAKFDECAKKIPLLDSKINQFEKELKILTEKSKDENITIKQHNEYLYEIELKKEEIKVAQEEIFRVNRTMRKAEEKINELKMRIINI